MRIDIQHAFRNLPIHLEDLHLLSFIHELSLYKDFAKIGQHSDFTFELNNHVWTW